MKFIIAGCFECPFLKHATLAGELTRCRVNNGYIPAKMLTPKRYDTFWDLTPEHCILRKENVMVLSEERYIIEKNK